MLCLIDGSGRTLFDMRRRQFHFDDMCAKQGSDLNGIADDVDCRLALLAETRAARIRPYDNRQAITLCLFGIGAELSVHLQLMCRPRIDREPDRATPRRNASCTLAVNACIGIALPRAARRCH